MTTETYQAEANVVSFPTAPAAPTPAPSPAPSPAPAAEVKIDPPDELLVQILTTRRCHGSAGDINFRTSLLAWMKKNKVKHRVAEPGSIIATVGKDSTTMFSCHMDTVHNQAESNTKQTLFFDDSFGHIFLGDKKSSTCLGADDGAGIWMLMQMIGSKVPGTYVFHVGEERGGIGSRAILEKEREWLKKFDRAIAFDRAGDNEIIITQGGSECASPQFGNALCMALKEHGLDYVNSHKGSFTDTKVYAGVIPECINVGVGYYNQHGSDEYLDIVHLRALLAACLKIKWESLKPMRKPVVYQQPTIPRYQSSPPFRGYKDLDDDDMFPRSVPATPPARQAVSKPTTLAGWQELLCMDRHDIEEMVSDDPVYAIEAISELVEEYEALKARVEVLRRLYT